MAKQPTAESVKCSVPRCGGVLFDTTSRLAESQGVLHRRCDRCGARWAFQVTDRPQPMRVPMRAILVAVLGLAALTVPPDLAAAPVPKEAPKADLIQPGYRWWDSDFNALLEATRVDGEVVTFRNVVIPTREYLNMSKGLKVNQIYKKDIRAMLARNENENRRAAENK